MKINCISNGLPAENRNLIWYLSKLDRRTNKTITFDSSKAIYISDQLATTILDTRIDDVIIRNGESSMLVSSNPDIIEKYRKSELADIRFIEVSDMTIDLSDDSLVDKLRDNKYLKEKVDKCDIQPAIEIYELASQATGLSVDQIKSALLAVLGSASIILMEQMNEECEDPMLELGGVGLVSIEDNKPIILSGSYGLDKFTNLQLSADQMLYDLINRTNKERLDIARGDSDEQ